MCLSSQNDCTCVIWGNLPAILIANIFFSSIFVVMHRIMEREKQLSILYQKQGRATQFPSKAARDKWLQKEIDDLERVLSSNLVQVNVHIGLF